ncbi:hypothetical protein M426DRAFT_251924 [Hypoxylon sp. CI-4A]|nr:hypothetical protein M426DRAFT_251924 [Hypoxylon sp. CI-4A]
MSFIIKTTALATLASLVSANPILSRGETDCVAGKVFYSCANGYRGCFEKDPCALPPVATTSIVLPTTSATATATSIILPTATTTTTPSSTAAAAACPTGTASASIWQPTMYNLYPSDPDLAQDPVSYLQVQVHEQDPQLEQVAAFHGIPSEAKKCFLGWGQGKPEERTFVVDHSGLTSLFQLTGFPAEPVSSNSVAPFVPADSTHADFTSWDDASHPEQKHDNGEIDCAESIYFKLALDTENGDGHVYMEQDAKNGLFVSYTC